MNSVTEWSVAFDRLYDNITSGQAPGLNEYEKSLFLTRAQEGLVLDYFSPKSNQLLEGFDGSPKRQSDFSSLIRNASGTVVTSTTNRVDKRSTTKAFTFPAEDIVAVLDEHASTGMGTSLKMYTVVPITYEEYQRLMMKPYKYPPKGIVWRLTTTLATTPQVELIGRFDGDSMVQYWFRYVTRPEPIILEALTGGLMIEGNTATAECKLPEHLHNEILQRAVYLAKIAWNDQIPNPSPVR